MTLSTPTAFFDRVRDRDLLGPVLTSTEVKGCETLLAACYGMAASWTAYCLATAYHETAGTMLPIGEYGGNAYKRRLYDIEGARPKMATAMGNTTPGDGVRYAGRGYVQLTWKSNYDLAGRKLGLPLVADPDLAMVPLNAARIMARGMVEGWFTGRKLADFLIAGPREDRLRYKLARKIINGLDRADDIALHADAFEDALSAGGWTQ